jgi:hypothetical protein
MNSRKSKRRKKSDKNRWKEVKSEERVKVEGEE